MKYPALSTFSDMKRDIFIFFSVAAIFYFLTAWFGTTYFHPDQQFQTLEWADFKRSGTGEEALPWEYKRAIRPWIQPYFYVLILDVTDVLGVTNPFMQDRIIRLLTAALGMGSLILLAVTIGWWLPLKGQRRLLVGVLSLTALFPNVMTRTSSEAMASICMMLAFVALFLLRRNPQAVTQGPKMPLPFTGKMQFSYPGLFLSGVAVALAFQFRYQAGPAFVVLFLWMLFAAKAPVRQLLVFVLAILLVTVTATLVDSIGYGRFVLAPWNNVRANIFDGIAATFGVQPWYFYFDILSSNPIGASLVVAMVLYLLRFPTNLLSLFVGFFFIQHSLIAHKEARFMFPLIPFVVAMIPLLFPRAWFGPTGTGVPFFNQNVFAKLVGFTFLIINTVGLYQVSFPSLKPEIATQKFVIDTLPADFEYTSLGASIYRSFPDAFGDYPLRMEFYKPAFVTHNIVASVRDLAAVSPDKPFTFFMNSNDLPADTTWDEVRKNCAVIQQSITPTERLANPKAYDHAREKRSLYRCLFRSAD